MATSKKDVWDDEQFHALIEERNQGTSEDRAETLLKQHYLGELPEEETTEKDSVDENLPQEIGITLLFAIFGSGIIYACIVGISYLYWRIW